jgi:phage major head subunit gpT-like protein
MLLNSASLAALETGLRSDFNKGLLGVEPQWTKVATEIPSTGTSNTYGWVSGWPKLREWIGDRVVKRLAKSGYVLVNRDFEGTVAVQRNHIQDDQLGVYGPMSRELGQSATEWPDELVFSLLPKGFETECYDGQNFFDEEHKVGDETVSNMQDGAGEPWFLLDTRRPLKPLIWQPRQKPQFVALDDPKAENVFMRKEFLYGVDARGEAGYAFWQQAFGSRAPLTAANYEAAVQAMASQRNEEDRPLNVKPSIIVVGPGNRAAAKKLFEAMLVNGGESNTLYKDVEIVESQWVVG